MTKKQPTFEEALKQLETLTEQIERGEIGLEESITKYEQGMKLVAQCRSILNRAEQRVRELQSAEEETETRDETSLPNRQDTPG